MAESDQRKPQPHGLMICFPLQGHINPFVWLALKLASKGFIITFVHLESVHYKLAKAHAHAGDDFFSEARRSGLDIRYATMPDPFPLEFDRDLNFDYYWETMLREFPAIVDHFVSNLIRSSESDPLQLPTFLVTDTVYSSWPLDIATKYKLLNVSFWTQPALLFTMLYHLDLLSLHAHFPCKDNIEEEINYLPGVESINTRDLMSSLREAESQGIVMKFLAKGFTGVKRADFVLLNTVFELESQTLNALNKFQPNYAIGPINFTKNLPTNTVRTSLRSESDCTKWLESKSPGSVLYISFGSFVQMSKQDIEEIAYALQLSQVDFIWVVRDGVVSASADANVLPVGYESEIKERGLIVPWCDQVMVLSNPAVGGFLTHCGWNSVIESMWCGVPMICYPLMFDQPANRKLVVEDLKIGIDIRDHGKSVDRNEAAAKINNFMSSNRLREESHKVKTTLRRAMEVDGSSEISFENFVHDLKAKIYAI
ncbi:hypothetical protein C2S53_002359 [Perilla frutescens var. hirtella]|uniref:Glycosyltransferase n=1 Tax=Perilla frutescens var. hirtella TaxID=608512 RepID=A0AAD4P410_PERFH|nr:hypothetical protein C2S53_002359 [Perilla frutescens var. hirtella]